MTEGFTKQDVFELLDEGLMKVVEHLKSEYAVIKAGRANPRVLDRVMVSYYGAMTPLNQMGNISVADARSLIVSVWDLSAFQDIKKAIMEANLGLGMSDDGKSIRLSFPALTEERRKEIVKSVKKLAEDNKVACRNCRRDALDEFKSMKKDSVITEDELSTCEKEVQKRLDNTIANIDKLAVEKEKEIMQV